MAQAGDLREKKKKRRKKRRGVSIGRKKWTKRAEMGIKLGSKKRRVMGLYIGSIDV